MERAAAAAVAEQTGQQELGQSLALQALAGCWSRLLVVLGGCWLQ